MSASDTIELGEDINFFTNCFELVTILKNSPYYYDLIVLDKKNQIHYELQVPFKNIKSEHFLYFFLLDNQQDHLSYLRISKLFGKFKEAIWFTGFKHLKNSRRMHGNFKIL